MAKLTGPLFSLGASGTVGKAIVFGSWKGIAYARKYVVPENPDTADQQEVRGVFTTLANLWKLMPQLARNPFQAAVRGRALTDRNRHVQASAAALNGESDLNNLVMSVASGSATLPTGMSAAGAAGQIDITGTPADPPVGYTLEAIVAVAVEDGDPSPGYSATTYAEEVTSAPWAVSISGLAAGDYQVGIFAEYSRDSDSETFYSEAIRSQETVT